jgi:hypothetical protein
VPDPATSRAVLIGASDYDSMPRLPSVRHNVIDLRDALTDPERGVFSPEHCHTFFGEGDPSDLHVQLEKIAAEATDTFLFYFAGHGLPELDIKVLRLALCRAKQNKPQYGSLELKDVWEICRLSPAARRVMILDCCFSGRALAIPNVSGLLDLQVAGNYALASASIDDVAYAPADKRNTMFTGELLDVLRNGIPDGPPDMTIHNVVTHLTNVMREKKLRLPRPATQGTPDGLVIAHNPSCRSAQELTGDENVGSVSQAELQLLALHCEDLPANLVLALYHRIMDDLGYELDQSRASTISVISRLNQLAHTQHEIPRLLKFVIMAAQETRDTALSEWIDQVAGRLGMEAMVDAVRKKVARQVDLEPLSYFLVVHIKRDLGRARRYLAKLTAHRDARTVPKPFDEERSWSVAELRRELPALIVDNLHTDAVTRDRVTIEFLVPRELLPVAFDEWPSPVGETLGFWYRVVVCDLDRDGRYPPQPDWVRKWKYLQKQLGAPPADHQLCRIRPTDNPNPTRFRSTLVKDDRWICIALDAAPQPHHRKLVDIGIDVGGPAAIWPRGTEVEPSAVRDVLGQNGLALLPDLVRDLRRDAAGAGTEHIGRSLTLLWDDPTRVQPPESPLVTPAQKGVPG